MADNSKKLTGMLKKPHIRAVVFDLDDTLWPLIPLIHEAEQALLDWLKSTAPAALGQHSIASLREMRSRLLPTDARFAYDLWALRHAMLTELFSAEDHDADRVRARSDAGMQVFARARNQVSLYGDVLPALTEMGRHFQLGSISNGFADLRAIGLAGHFNVSLAAHQFGCAKPDPRIFLAACEALGVAPQHTVYVGDDVQIDVQGARSAGLRSVWMNRAGRAAAHEADYECRDLTELAAWLLN